MAAGAVIGAIVCGLGVLWLTAFAWSLCEMSKWGEAQEERWAEELRREAEGGRTD